MIQGEFTCPLCGSEFFLSDRSGNKIVFKVGLARQAVSVTSTGEAAEVIEIESAHCGGCSWSGKLTETIPAK